MQKISKRKRLICIAAVFFMGTLVISLVLAQVVSVFTLVTSYILQTMLEVAASAMYLFAVLRIRGFVSKLKRNKIFPSEKLITD